MAKAVRQAVLAVCLRCSFVSPSTNPRKMGVFVMGFIMAKKPVNTVSANPQVVVDMNK